MRDTGISATLKPSVGDREGFCRSAILLVLDAANDINGEILTVDGGWMGR